MMSSDQKVVISSRGVGFCGLLFIVLLLLKVGVVETTVVGWSWWVIAAPLWGPVCLVVSIISIVLFVMVIIFILTGVSAMIVRDQKKRKARKTTKE